MGEGLSHWSSMVLRKSQTCFSDRHTHPNSMYSNFCHVLKKDLYTYLSSYSFEVFCKQDLLETENTEIVIDESKREYIVKELEMSEDEYKQRCKTYDILEVANRSIDYYLLTKHPDILLEYYKLQGYEEPEQMFKNKMKLYSMCKR